MRGIIFGNAIAIVLLLGTANAATGELCPATVTAAQKFEPVGDQKPTDKNTSQLKEIRLGDVIELKVLDLPSLYTEACGWTAERTPVLYLNGLALNDHDARPRSDPSGGSMYFTLQRTEASRDVWNALLGEPGPGTKPVNVSVGYADRFAIPSDA